MRTTRPRLIATLFVSASLIGSTWATSAIAATKTSCSSRKPCTTADTTPPQVGISAPTSGSTVRGTVTVAGTAADNVGVSRVDVSVDGGAAVTASGTSSWGLALNTASYADGPHTITATARDTAGNVSSASVTVTVDNVADPSPAPPPPPADTAAPSVTIAAPTGGATVSGTANVTGTASDNVALDRVEVLVDGGPSRIATGTSNWSSSIDTTSLADGSHTVTSRAFDTAGNATSTSVAVSVQNSTPTSGGSGAPNTQGVWRSPEGATIDVNTAGPWTISQVYGMLKASSIDLDKLAPTLTVKVQDVYASQTASSASTSNGRYVAFSATIYLKGVNSGFSATPDAVVAHEYGHAWSTYHLYLSQQGDWTGELNARQILGDSRLDSTYNWSRDEIIADDYRLLFGSATAISQRPSHLNADIPDPRNVTGLRDYLSGPWRTAH